MRISIAVVGAAEPSAEACEQAAAVGAAVAVAGATLVTGGLGGIMEAACKGARENGGLTVGILPGTSKEDANPYVDCALPTGLGDFRNYLVVAAADALIALEGRFGTLSEMSMALTLGKRVVGLGAWEIEGVRAVDSVEDAVRVAVEAARAGGG
ncbi:MAG: TIGR00725 family protein [Acidobacteriota bacterium]|nr:MAG: TIGR00725 family protein [Acidobacteriota bacterium]